MVNWLRYLPEEEAKPFPRGCLNWSKEVDNQQVDNFYKKFGFFPKNIYKAPLIIPATREQHQQLPEETILVGQEKNSYISNSLHQRAEYTEIPKRNEIKQESTRKTENLLRALTAIAIDDYGYDPDSAKSCAPQDIANAISNHGVTFDPKTIRNWLKEGAALLSSNEEKN